MVLAQAQLCHGWTLQWVVYEELVGLTERVVQVVVCGDLWWQKVYFCDLISQLHMKPKSLEVIVHYF